MWNDILEALERHDSAVLTAFDSQGLPMSVRCEPVADRANNRLLLEIPNGIDIQPGKAGLLMHSHNEELWDLVQFLVRGTLSPAEGGWHFVPASAQGSPHQPGMLGTIKQLRAMRATADRYLKSRGIERPKVPWEDIQRLQREAAELRQSRN